MIDGDETTLTLQERHTANVSVAMGTKDLSDRVYRTSHGKTFQNVAISEMMLSDKLLKTRNYHATQVKPSGIGIDMSNVQKPIRGVEELEQILFEEESSVGRVSEEGRLQYNTILNVGVGHSKVINSVNQKRKVNHDAAMKLYDQAVVDISEELELQVIEQCRLLRDDELIEIDRRIKQILCQLEHNDDMRFMNHQDVLNVWNNTNKALIERKNYIENYANFLSIIETTRSQKIGSALSTLAEYVVSIGYLLRDEAVRIIESRKFYRLTS
jgi:hypothetical protein